MRTTFGGMIGQQKRPSNQTCRTYSFSSLARRADRRLYMTWHGSTTRCSRLISSKHAMDEASTLQEHSRALRNQRKKDWEDSLDELGQGITDMTLQKTPPVLEADAEATPATPYNQTSTALDTGRAIIEVVNSQIPEGTVLDNTFRITGFLKSENHSDVYRVVRSNAEESLNVFQENEEEAFHGVVLQARAFSFEGISPSLAKYRRRSMSRLQKGNRTVCVTTWSHLRVIIYRPDEASPSLQHTIGDKTTTKAGKIPAVNESKEASTGLHQGDKAINPTQSRPRSSYQRESRKLRQRDRRQRRRRLLTPTGIGDQYRVDNNSMLMGTTVGNMKFDEQTFTMIMMLHFMHDTKASQRNRLPQATRSLLESYMAMRERQPHLASEEEMEEFLDIKEREMAYLNRKLAQIPTVLDEYHSRIERSIHRQETYKRGSAAWTSLQDRKLAAMREFQILRQAHCALRGVIASTKKVAHSVRGMLLRARQERMTKDGIEATEERKAQLRTDISRYERWKDCVVPSSGAFVLLDTKSQIARETLEQME